MFNIYADGVRDFSGTLEQLYENRFIERVSRADADPPPPDAETPQGGGRRRGEAFGATPAAVSAYRKALNLNAREPILHAHQIMRSPVVSIRADVDMRDAWALLREHGIRQIPVETPSAQLVGLLSERDLLKQLIVERDVIRYGAAKSVSDLMDREVITAEPVTEVRRIARVMVDRRMTAMPVVTDRDELVGIISRGDLLRAMTREPPLRIWT